jgi:hypothetical protein
MDGARPRAAAGRTADTAKFGLYRSDAGLKSIKNCRHLAERDKLMTSIQVRDSEIA